MYYLIFLLIGASAYTPNNLPNPNGWIDNPDNILTNNTVSILNNTINDFMSNFTIQCGDVQRPYQIFIVVIYKIDSGFTDETFSSSVMDRFGVGYQPCNNGVVILLSVNDSTVYISTGAGSSKQLDSDAINAILNSALGQLELGHWNDAIITILNNTILALKNSKGANKLAGGVIVAIVIGSIAAAAVLSICVSRAWNRMNENIVSYSQRNYSLNTVLVERKENDIELRQKPTHNVQPVPSAPSLEQIEQKLSLQKEAHPSSLCPICLDDFPEKMYEQNEENQLYYLNMEIATKHHITTVECGHVFHIKCIKTSVDKYHECPLCRHKIDKVDEPVPPTAEAVYEPKIEQKQPVKTWDRNCNVYVRERITYINRPDPLMIFDVHHVLVQNAINERNRHERQERERREHQERERQERERREHERHNRELRSSFGGGHHSSGLGSGLSFGGGSLRTSFGGGHHSGGGGGGMKFGRK